LRQPYVLRKISHRHCHSSPEIRIPLNASAIAVGMGKNAPSSLFAMFFPPYIFAQR